MKHARDRRNRNRLLRGRAGRGGGALTLRQQIGAVLGVEPQVFADARDLTVGDGNAVATWGDWSGAEGTPTLDTDGWGGSLPMIIPGDANDIGFYTTADVVNYGSLTPSVWVVTGRTIGAFGNSSILSLTLGRNSGDDQRFWGTLSSAQARFRTRADVSTTEVDTGSNLPTSQLAHLGVAFDGAHVTVIAMTSSGPSTLISAPHGLAESLTFDELILGAGVAAWDSSLDGFALSSVTRCSAGAATLANLQAILNLHNQAYPVA